MLSIDFLCYVFLLPPPTFAETVSQIFHLFHGLDLEGLKPIKLFDEGCDPNIVSDVYV